MRKWLVSVAGVMLLAGSPAAGAQLITGSTKYNKFQPGDQVLYQTDFSRCPVGEAPSGFNKISGAGECVKYQDHIWIAPSTNNDWRLYKKLDLGRGGLSIEWDLLEYQDISGAIGPKFTLRLLESRGPAWDRARPPYDVEVVCYYDACHVRLEGVGEVGAVKGIHRKKFHLAVQARRRQFRIFINGRRAVAMPFTRLTPKQHVSGFELMFVGDTNAHGILVSNLKVARYSSREAKPTPEKLGIQVTKTATGLRLTVPEKVLFDFNQFTLKPAAKQALHAVADLIRSEGSRTIAVTGYTDNVGGTAYNLKLSLQRAQSVADYLMDCEKIPPEKFRITGKGAANPIADNRTAAGRAKNRRVEIRLIR